MHKSTGAEIESVRPGSPACLSGIVSGDIVETVNGNKIHDAIDCMFYGNVNELDISLRRCEKKLSFKLLKQEGQDIGIEIKPFKIKTCTNKCIFCFVSQLPKGLRKTLYIKDEDYRMSFLYGNYVTLTNLTPQDKKRIIEQRLSPIYISVHSTNTAVRNMILGNPKAPDVLKEIGFFKGNKIRMHCQVVMCPGINDGKELQRTIRDLYGFYPYILSAAVVPVGLTAHRKGDSRMRPVTKDDALHAIEIIDSFQKRFRKKHGDPIVYGADELYIKAEVNFPPLNEYGDLPQLENGIGMVPLFTAQARSLTARRLRDKTRLSVPADIPRKRFITFTGMSFYPYLKKFTDRLIEKEGINLTAVPVENNFFGKSVTVTGLLTGRDIIKAVSDKTDAGGIAPYGKSHEASKGSPTLLIPDIVLRTGDKVFLDDLSVKDISDALSANVRVIESTPAGLIEGIEAS